MALYTMKELLQDAQEKKYGVGFFNTFNTDMAVSYTHLTLPTILRV